jgi:hypothetical protein
MRFAEGKCSKTGACSSINKIVFKIRTIITFRPSFLPPNLHIHNGKKTLVNRQKTRAFADISLIFGP